jgi:hypothetical protein
MTNTVTTIRRDNAGFTFEGTTSGCSRITVKIVFQDSSGNLVSRESAPVNPNVQTGGWTVTIPAGDFADFSATAEICGGTPKIFITCLDDGTEQELQGPPVECPDVPPPDDRGCPDITLSVDVSDDCESGTRSAAVSVTVVPFAQASVDFGDGSAQESVNLQQVNVQGTTIGTGAASHNYTAPNAGSTTFQATVTIAGRPECFAVIDVAIAACPQGPPPNCPRRVKLRIEDANGVDVTEQVEDGQCLPPGRYWVRATTEPLGVPATFIWNVDGANAQVGQRDVVAITGDRLTIELGTTFRSVSVIVAGCDMSDGIDLRPCLPPNDDDGNGNGDHDNGGTDNGDEGGGCLLLRVLALAFLVVGLVLTVAGIATGNEVLCFVGVGLMAVGIILLFIWLFSCASVSGCRVLQRIIQILEAILLLMALVALVGIFTAPACAGGVAVDGAFLGILLSLLHRVFDLRRCRWQRDWLDDLLGLGR